MVCLGAETLAQQSTVRATLPNGRTIEPVGTWTTLAPYPFALALRGDGHEAAIPSIGFPFALNLVAEPGSDRPVVRRLPATAAERKEIETHAGVAYSPDGATLYVTTGDSGKIAAYETVGWTKAAEISLDGPDGGPDGGQTYTASFAATLVGSRDGRRLYALDQANWRVAVVDLPQRRVVASVATGAYPFGLALSPDETRLYVTNTGLFEYTALAPTTEADRGLRFPPFGYPSAAAQEGATVEGRAIPGLGDENSTRGSSLWTYALREGSVPAIVGRLRLGERISSTANGTVGGAAPSGVVATADAVYVALSHADAVAKVSADGQRLLVETPLSPFTEAAFHNGAGRPLRGIMPSGLAVDAGRLYVAESGINAVAVLDTATMQVIEHIPAGWNPSAVAVHDGTLYIVNAKGRGTGANAGEAHDAKGPSYIGALEYGSLQAVKLGSLALPEVLSATVVATNKSAVTARPKLPRLKHCFLIIRENRTFDEVLGDLPGARGDASLARYGMAGWAEEAKVIGLRVTPNLHALAAQFGTSDNFFVDADVSADGHRWVMGINPTPFFNTAWTSNYGGRRKSSPKSPQPGRRAMFGGADAPMPEDEPQFGSLWEHVARSGKGILNYGEGLELEGSDEGAGFEPEGQRLHLNAPLPQPLFEATDRRFPTFNLGIPDQLRAAEFKRDFTRRMRQGRIPGLIVIRLPNDHTAEIRPADGYLYRASFVADNDLATGEIIAFLSRTPLWKDSAVFITEDDAQGGVDHIDAHRSVLAIASPWVKPGVVSHTHSSMGSITRTIDELLGVGPMNLEDALAGELIEVFDSTPHFGPFHALATDPRVFDPIKARVAHPKSKMEAAALRNMDDPAEIRPLVEAAARARRVPLGPHGADKNSSPIDLHEVPEH